MKITINTTIHCSADRLWQITGTEFDQAYKWMGFVKKSYKTETPSLVPEAPVAGRICEFTDKPNGLKARENILAYSDQDRRLVFDVVPVNQPAIFPVKKNAVTLTVKALPDNQATIEWQSDIELSAFGYLIYPFIKKGLSNSFGSIMNDLKHYAEEVSNPANAVTA